MKTIKMSMVEIIPRVHEATPIHFTGVWLEDRKVYDVIKIGDNYYAKVNGKDILVHIV